MTILLRVNCFDQWKQINGLHLVIWRRILRRYNTQKKQSGNLNRMQTTMKYWVYYNGPHFRRPTSAVRSIKALKILRQMLRCFSHDRSDCSTLSSFVESSSSSYLHLHELVALSSFGASGPEVVLKYIALGFPSFRQQQSLRTSYSQVSAKTNEVKRMEHLIKTTTSF